MGICGSNKIRPVMNSSPADDLIDCFVVCSDGNLRANDVPGWDP